MDKEGRLGRREFIKNAVLSGVAVGIWGNYLASSLIDPRLEPDIPPFVGSNELSDETINRIESQFRKPVLNPVPDIGTRLLYEYHFIEGKFKVEINRDGLPVRCTLPDGRQIPFDLNEVLRARNLAISSKETQLISVIELPPSHPDNSSDDIFPSSSISIKESDLPKDILSRQELLKRGVNIIQPPGEMELRIRQGAFEGDGLLSSSLNKSGKNLTIVLLDAPFLSKEFMQDKRYDAVRNLLRKEALQYVPGMRDEVLSFLKADLIALGNKSRDEYEGSLSYDFAQYDIARVKANIQASQSFVTNAQVLIQNQSELKRKNSDDYLGQYIYGKNLIFVSLGSPQFDTDIAFFYFDGQGNFNSGYNDGEQRVRRSSILPLDEYGIDGFDSLPDPNKFKVNPNASLSNPRSYPYAGINPGFVLRHEIVHSKFINGSFFSNDSEYDTDMEAMRGIREAWDKWQASGKKDNSGYYFAIRGSFGRYILT